MTVAKIDGTKTRVTTVDTDNSIFACRDTDRTVEVMRASPAQSAFWDSLTVEMQEKHDYHRVQASPALLLLVLCFHHHHPNHHRKHCGSSVCSSASLNDGPRSTSSSSWPCSVFDKHDHHHQYW